MDPFNQEELQAKVLHDLLQNNFTGEVIGFLIGMVIGFIGFYIILSLILRFFFTWVYKIDEQIKETS